MADVKWIKITTDIFADEKILLIESMPEADAMIVIWFKLLCLAGTMNNSGVFTMNNKIAYTDEMFSTIFRRPLNTVRLALDTFEMFGMIERVEGVVTIPKWEIHQNIDGLEKIREQTRQRVAKYRQKQASLECNVTETLQVTESNAIDKNRIEQDKNRIDYNYIFDSYNSICKSLPSVKNRSEVRKKAIKSRLSTHTAEELKEAFRLAEESDFLSGRSGTWQASFDWLMKEANLVKVLEGNYSNKTAPKKQNSFVSQGSGRQYDFEALEQQFINR